MSIRNVAMTYGIPARTVSRAIEHGDLPALRTITETGRERAYILHEDVEKWIARLCIDNESLRMERAQG